MDPLAHEFLERLNAAVKRKVTVVLIGGNALNILGFKGATADVDIVCRSSEPEVAKFCQEYFRRYGIKVEFFVDGLFSNIRVKDYLQKAYKFDQDEFPNIQLKIFNLYDIALTKINRLLQKDLDDLTRVLESGAITESELDARFKFLLKNTIGDKEHFQQQYQKFKTLFKDLLRQ